MPRNPVNRILIRMFFYGVVYGSLTSGFLFVALQLADTPNWSSSDLSSTFTFGLPVGAFFGGLAGIFSGLGIIILIDVFLPRPLNPDKIHIYRLSIGMVTACMGLLVLFTPFGLLSLLSSQVNNALILTFLIVSIAIAIYASQRTVTKYLGDIDPRKSKLKC